MATPKLYALVIDNSRVSDALREDFGEIAGVNVWILTGRIQTQAEAFKLAHFLIDVIIPVDTRGMTPQAHQYLQTRVRKNSYNLGS